MGSLDARAQVLLTLAALCALKVEELVHQGEAHSDIPGGFCLDAQAHAHLGGLGDVDDDALHHAHLGGADDDARYVWADVLKDAWSPHQQSLPSDAQDAAQAHDFAGTSVCGSPERFPEKAEEIVVRDRPQTWEERGAISSYLAEKAEPALR